MSSTWSRRRFLGVGAATAGSLVLVACAGDDDDETARQLPDVTSTTADVAPAPELPGDDTVALRDEFDPLLASLGLRITRGGLYDLSEGFVRDEGGTHLALYVEPIDDEGWDIARYLETLPPAMAAVTPYLFDTYSGLQTMDLCQEPPQAEAPEPEPPVMTQVVMSRADSGLVDWDRVDLVALHAARLLSPDTVRLAARPDVAADATWAAAVAAAQEQF